MSFALAINPSSVFPARGSAGGWFSLWLKQSASIAKSSQSVRSLPGAQLQSVGCHNGSAWWHAYAVVRIWRPLSFTARPDAGTRGNTPVGPKRPECLLVSFLESTL